MKVESNINLLNKSTFKINSIANNYIELNNINQINELVDIINKFNGYYILGEGSNTVFTRDKVDELIIHNKIKGIKKLRETDDFIDFEVSSGENFHDFVNITADQGLWGIENLAYIPGSVGAAPVQNIGAFGAEVKDSILAVKGVNKNFPGREICYYNNECNFSYRSSIFKEKLKQDFFITSVIFRLYKNGKPNVSYASLNKYIDERGLLPVTSKDMVNLITELRTMNYPDLNILGSVGSCFTNVVVNENELRRLKNEFPNIVYFDYLDGLYKIATAWLISNNTKYFAGYMYNDNIGLFKKHALQIVNYGNATPADFINFTNEIKSEIYNVYNLNIELEPNIVY